MAFSVSWFSALDTDLEAEAGSGTSSPGNRPPAPEYWPLAATGSSSPRAQSGGAKGKSLCGNGFSVQIQH